MRPPRLLPGLLPALAAASVLLLAGCTGNAVTIAGQGYQSGSESKSLECNESAHLAIGAQGTGKFSVTVKDGAGQTVFSDGSVSAGQDGQAQTLTGAKGTWTLRLSTGLGYMGQYGVTLSC